MESQPGKSESLITRRVQASTICLAPRTTVPRASGEPEFAVQLSCYVTKYIRPGRGRQVVRVYRGDGDSASFVAADPKDVPADKDGVRNAIRGLLRAIRPLRDLDLTDDEWEAIVPEDVLPQLADLARGHDGSRTASIALQVDRHVRFSARKMLITGCKKVAAAAEDADCGICLDPLRAPAGAEPERTSVPRARFARRRGLLRALPWLPSGRSAAWAYHLAGPL